MCGALPEAEAADAQAAPEREGERWPSLAWSGLVRKAGCGTHCSALAASQLLSQRCWRGVGEGAGPPAAASSGAHLCTGLSRWWDSGRVSMERLFCAGRWCHLGRRKEDFPVLPHSQLGRKANGAHSYLGVCGGGGGP